MVLSVGGGGNRCVGGVVSRWVGGVGRVVGSP